MLNMNLIPFISSVRSLKLNPNQLKRVFHKDYGKCVQMDLNGPKTMNQYPAMARLKIPSNIKDMCEAEKTRFSRQRNRDVSSIISAISYDSEQYGDEAVAEYDSRVENYDSTGHVNLSAAMQTNVPFPFPSKGKTMHLNMPRGQWRQEEKYTSGELHHSHHVNNTFPVMIQLKSGVSDRHSPPSVFPVPSRYYSTENNLSNAEKLKIALKEYGGPLVVVHVSIALLNLGFCYAVVKSGFDYETTLRSWGVSEGAIGAGAVAPFVIAYGLHKLSSGARIALSVLITPWIVKVLKKRSLTKKPQN